MIRALRFQNFYSFADEAFIDFSLGKKPTPSGFDIQSGDARFNKVVATIGANGSGKTQFLKPLAFLSWFVTQSFLNNDPEANIPCEPHKLNVDQPTFFELEFSINGQDYRYELQVLHHVVMFEALFEKTSTQYSYLFKREQNDQGYQFRQKGFPFHKAQAERTRGNASLLGAAYNYDVAEAKPFIDFFSGISANIVHSGRQHFQQGALLSVAERLVKQPELLAKVASAMCQFDLGLSGVVIRKAESRNSSSGEKQTIHLPFGQHKTEEGQEFELPFLQESSGTQSAFVLLAPILQTLQDGGVAVIDELDNDLHPHLVPHLLEWFEYDHTNPHEAQLIFTCHTPEVLNLLQKHQVYLIEKRNQLSEAWRLDEMTGLRADENLYAKYMAGALGATPEL